PWTRSTRSVRRRSIRWHRRLTPWRVRSSAPSLTSNELAAARGRAGHCPAHDGASTMTWFRRGTPPPTQQDPQEDEDTPDALRRRLWDLVQLVNRSAGQLPVDAVVLSRKVTDTIREVIETSTDHQLDIYAVVQVN